MKLSSKLTTASLAAAAYLSTASSVFAQGTGNVELCPDGNFSGGLCTNPTFDTLFGRIITILIIVGISIALLFLIWGGIKWIMSGGDKAKVESARGTIIGAIIGLVIVLAAFFILNFVVRLITGGDIGSLSFDALLK